MEQKKWGWIYQRWAKFVTVLLVIVSSAACILFGTALLSVFGNDVSLSEVQEGRDYADTNRASREAEYYLRALESFAGSSKIFGEGGGYNPLKLIDITNWKAAEEEQNENTTYTMEQLLAMLSNYQYSEIRRGLDTIEYNDYYGYEASYDVQLDGYTSEFKYLYSEVRPYEAELPRSGISLAEYARQNGDSVSLRELYSKLTATVEAARSYMDSMSDLQRESNVCYFMENTDTGEILTNVEGWTQWDQAAAQAAGWENGCIFQRVNGVFQLDPRQKEICITPEYSEFLLSNIILGKNERGVVSININYPVKDELRTNMEFYEKVMPWTKVFLAGFCVALVLLIAFWILAGVQAGKQREKDGIILRRIDRLPTELEVVGFFLLACIPIAAMTGSEGFYEANSMAAAAAFVAAMSVLLTIIILDGYLSLVRRIKAHNLWENSLLRVIVHSCQKLYEARTASGKVILSFCALIFFNLMMAGMMSGFGLLLALMTDLIVLLYLVRESAGRQTIKEGLARISDGDLNYKIALTDLKGDNLEMAEAVNHVGEGLQNAVQKSMKSERLKADLITNVSHDIKTPLTSIINYVDLLKREEIQNEKAQDYIRILDRKSQRLKQLTEDLVEASKVSSGNVTLEMQNLNFNELIQQTNGEFAEQFEARNLELVCHLPEEGLVVYADGRRIWRVIENLYRNVAKYAMPGTRVYVDVFEKDQRVFFTIKNISEYPLNIAADELTERFIRGDVSRSTEGSGLGLSIAKNLAILQKGTFDIYLDGDLFKVIVSFARVEPKREKVI